MKNTFSVITISMILASAGISAAGEGVKADRVVDLSKSRVSYVIEAAGGEYLVITADYAETRPDPEIENIDIEPLDTVDKGTRKFRMIAKEGVPIEIEYVYSRGELTGMKISAEPPNPSSDAEYPQVLSVDSKGGNVINFTFIWQGKDLKEVRIEPLVNPFA
ncbi:MAG: hypothetical protein V1682_03590 [Candidatus Omnitrophota bacterium]